MSQSSPFLPQVNVFQGTALEHALAAFIPTRRWFRTKSRVVRWAHIDHTFPLGTSRIALVDVTLDDATIDTYVVPLAFVREPGDHAVILRTSGGAVVEATSRETFLAALLGRIARGGTIQDGNATLAFHPLPALHDAALAIPARPVEREQTNTSIFFGDRFVGKIVRKIDPGASPDLEMGRALTELGYKHTPALAAWVDVVRGSEPPATVALLHELVPNQGDAWGHVLGEIAAFVESPGEDVPYTDLAEKLGRRVGEMHVALASRPNDPAFEAVPLDPGPIADAVIASATGLLHVAPRVAEIPARLERARRLRDVADTGMKIRVHGDLHLGQVLFTGDDFVIIDFEGEPARPLEERRAKRSPLVDVAGILRSYHYAVANVARGNPHALRFRRAACDAFLRGWLAVVEPAALVPSDPEDVRALLDLFLLEKCVYEIGYELDNRPEWIDVPLEGLDELLGPKASPAPIDARSPALAAFHQGAATHAHALFGVHPHESGGVSFATWQPNAASVAVVGDFGGAGAESAEPLAAVGDGVFAGVVKGVKLGDRYRYRVTAPDGSSFDTTDPFALGGGVTGFGTDAAQATSTVAAPSFPFVASSPAPARSSDPIAIYEVHLPTWRAARNAPSLARHARAMDFTHVMLLGCRAESAEELMATIDALHAEGLAAIVDDLPPHGWGTTDLDVDVPEVRSLVLSRCVWALEKLRADGLHIGGVEKALYRGDRSKIDEKGAAFLRDLTGTLRRERPGVLLFTDAPTAFEGVTRGAQGGGLGFDYAWDVGLSYDMRAYLAVDPVERARYQEKLTFRSMYSARESWVSALSHEDVKLRSLFDQLAGDPWQKLANLRLLYASLYAQPGKKLLFMGDELASPEPWSLDRAVAPRWDLLDKAPHADIARMIRDLNALHRAEPALHVHDQVGGFSWIDATNAGDSVITFLRHGARAEDDVVCAFNFTPVPRPQYRIGVPRVGSWKEIFNSDARDYGGSGHGNLGGASGVPYPWNGRPASILVTLPPLGAVFFSRRWSL